MPGNIILINGSIEYELWDSKMDDLLKYLDKHGTKVKELNLKVQLKTKEVKKDA